MKLALTIGTEEAKEVAEVTGTRARLWRVSSISLHVNER